MALNLTRSKPPAKKTVAKKIAPTPSKAAPRRPRYEDDDDRPSTRQRPSSPEGAVRGSTKAGWGHADETTSGGEFVKSVVLKDGEEVVLRFLEDEPYASFRVHWLERTKGKRSYPCPGDTKKPVTENDCPFCEYGISYRSEVRFNVAVLTEDDPIVMSLNCGPRMLRKVKSYSDDPKFRPLTKKHYFYRRTGTGFKTEYSFEVARSIGDIEEYYPDLLIPSSEALEELTLFTTEQANKEFAPLAEMRKVANEVITDDDED